MPTDQRITRAHAASADARSSSPTGNASLPTGRSMSFRPPGRIKFNASSALSTAPVPRATRERRHKVMPDDRSQDPQRNALEMALPHEPDSETSDIARVSWPSRSDTEPHLLRGLPNRLEDFSRLFCAVPRTVQQRQVVFHHQGVLLTPMCCSFTRMARDTTFLFVGSEAQLPR